jgi:outer membrane protein TolC
MLPDIQGTYNQSRFQGVVQVFGSQTVPVYQTRIVPQATAVWTVNPGGKDVFIALAAKQRARGAKFQLNQTLQEQLAQATIEYYELIAAGVNVANTRANIQEVQSQVALNDARLKAGVGTKLDLERAKTQLIEREQELITNENNLAKAQQALLNRLNLDPDVALIPPQVKAQAHILIPLTTNTEQLVSTAIANNPSLKVIEQEIRAIGYEGKSVLSTIVPTVTLQAYINGTGPEISKLGLGRFGGLSVQANLLNKLGTAIPLDYRTKRLQVAQQKIKLAEQVRSVQTDVINGFLDSRAGAQSIFTAQEQLDVAEESYRLAFGRYKAGLGINVDVLTAQTDLALARVRVVRAIFDFNEAQVRLLQAVGEVSTPHILNGINANAFTKKQKPSP